MHHSAKYSLKGAQAYLVTLMKWLCAALIVGSVCGVVGVAFHHLVEEATHLRQQHGWLLWLLPLGGVTIVFLYRRCGVPRDRGTNLVIESVRSGEKLPLVMAPLIFVSSVITHLLGGSAGREGAALQIGGSIGAWMGRRVKLSPPDLRVMTMCGMSAVFSAVFGTPITAAVFALEVVNVGLFYYAAMAPCLMAAAVSFGVALALGVAPVGFVVPGFPALSPMAVAQVVVLGALSALVSILFCQGMHLASSLYQKFFQNPYLRAAVGGCLVVAVSLALGTRDYNGAGMDVITRAINGEAFPVAFLLKLLLTALTLGAGFKGGEIVPSFFVGATFGCVVGPLLGLDPGFAASIGLAAVFCGVVNCPLASLLLCVELFGSGSGVHQLLLYAIACAVSYMLSGYHSLYSGQKFVSSKLRARSRIHAGRE